MNFDGQVSSNGQTSGVPTPSPGALYIAVASGYSMTSATPGPDPNGTHFTPVLLGNSFGPSLFVYTKTAIAGDSGQTYTLSSGGFQQSYAMLEYDGAQLDSTSPSVGAGNNVISGIYPGITLTAPSLVLAIFESYFGNLPLAPPTGFTTRVAYSVSGAIAVYESSSLMTGTIAAGTWGFNLSGFDYFAAALVAIHAGSSTAQGPASSVVRAPLPGLQGNFAALTTPAGARTAGVAGKVFDYPSPTVGFIPGTPQ